MQERIQIFHQLKDKYFYFPNWELKYLLVGTFNPTGGDRVNYFYGRESNYCWPTLSKIFEKELNPESESFIEALKELGIACVDMIDSVDVEDSWKDKVTGKGYSDSNIIRKKVIREYNTEDILKIIEANPNVQVFSTWGKGPQLKVWIVEIQKIDNLIKLVSPSAAARVPKGAKKEAYIFDDWSQKIIPSVF